MPLPDPSDAETLEGTGVHLGASRGVFDLLSVSLAAIVALFVGGVVYQFYETDAALLWNPNLLAATAYIWPAALFVTLYIWGGRRVAEGVQDLKKSIALGIVGLVFGPSFGVIIYLSSRVFGLPGFELFAGIGALLLLYPLLRFAANHEALRSVLLLSLPGLPIALWGLLLLEQRYLLFESMGEGFMDPNAQLLLVMTVLCLSTGFALLPYFADRPMRRVLGTYTRLAGLIAAALVLGAGALIWLNRAMLVPRLYLETHLLLGFFEWILLIGAIGWSSLLRLSFGRVNVERSSIEQATDARLPLKVAALALLFLASHGLLVFAPPTPGQPVPRRSDYLSEFFAKPYLLMLDSDGDGYLWERLGGVDCDDGRAGVNPLARERAGNGVDENCARGDLQAEAVATPAIAQELNAKDGDARLVIVISIDMLRPDFMQVYGAEDPTTPYLHENRDEWTRFEHAYTSGGITTLALPSLLRGRIPLAIDFEPAYRTLGYRYVFSRQGEQVNRVFASPRADQHPTIGSVFQQAGHPTRAIVDDGPAGIFQKGYGFEQGFDAFHYPNLPEGPGPEAWNLDTLTDTAVSLIEDGEAQGFWWLHIYDPHAAHPPCRAFGPTPGLGCYRDAIRDADQAVARIAEALQAAGQWDDTAIFITSDHGEALGEHGIFHHGLDSYEEYVRIPLLAKYPTSDGAPKSGVVTRPVSLIDVSTTALAVAGLQPPASFQGEDLRHLSEGQERRFPVISQLLITDTGGAPYRQQNLIVDDTFRLMLDRVTQKTWLFDLADDPGQKSALVVNGVGDEEAQIKADTLREELLDALERMEAFDTQSLPTKFP